jgi:hypothetical protein
MGVKCRQGFCRVNLDPHHYIFLIQRVISTCEQTPIAMMGKCLFQESAAVYWHNICSVLSPVRGSSGIYGEPLNQGAGRQHKSKKLHRYKRSLAS